MTHCQHLLLDTINSVITVYFRTSVQRESKDATDEDDAQEQEEEDMEEEEEEYDMMRQIRQRTEWTVTSSESGSAHRTQLCTRRIIAEDPSWSLSIVPSLTDTCIRHIADNFCCKSSPMKIVENI